MLTTLLLHGNVELVFSLAAFITPPQSHLLVAGMGELSFEAFQIAETLTDLKLPC